jgi:hypothetical protein
MSFERHAGLLQRVLRGRDGRGEHPDRVVAAHAHVVDARPRLEAVLLDRASLAISIAAEASEIWLATPP